MKRKIITFSGLLMATTLLFTGCQDDNDELQDAVPTTQVTTAKQFEDVEKINEQIKAFTENSFASESGFIPTDQRISKRVDCANVSGEQGDQSGTVSIDFGAGCEIDGVNISGKIEMSFTMDLNAENRIKISYTLENFKYEDITVSGNATSTFVFDINDQDGSFNFSFETIANFSFVWADGVSATNTSNIKNETSFNLNSDTAEFYTLNSGSSTTEFSNNDRYVVEITKPLRNEGECEYTVSGVIVTRENSETTTLDYGDGQCDNKATQTDTEGNETIIEL